MITVIQPLSGTFLKRLTSDQVDIYCNYYKQAVSAIRDKGEVIRLLSIGDIDNNRYQSYAKTYDAFIEEYLAFEEKLLREFVP